MAIDVEKLRQLHEKTTGKNWHRSYIKDTENLLSHVPAMLDEIERLRVEKQNAWNRGHQTGTECLKSSLKDMSKTKSDYLDENEFLTNLLLNAESEIERLRDENEKLKAMLARSKDNSRHVLMSCHSDYKF